MMSDVPFADPVRATTRVYDAKAAEFAHNWDRLPPREHDPVDLLLDVLRPRARVLDAGAGSGRDLQRLRAAGHDAVGLDRSLGLATLAAARAPMLVGDVRRLPLADKSLDAVLASASLLHLPATDLPIALDECRRVLADDGRLALTVKAGSGTTVDHAGRHFTLWTADELDTALAAAGFAIAHASTDTDQLRAHQAWLLRVAVAAPATA